jgi:hypothetical protein
VPSLIWRIPESRVEWKYINKIKMVIRFCVYQVLPIIVGQLCMAIVSGYLRQTTHNIYLIFALSGTGNE